jgi:hypothetical protein
MNFDIGFSVLRTSTSGARHVTFELAMSKTTVMYNRINPS